MVQFIIKFLRPLGMFLIFLLAATCIFGSIFVRDLDETKLLSKILYYTSSLESRFYDFRLKKNLNPQYKSKDIVLVKIDDYSLDKIGSWPIPRTEHAKLLDKLGQFGAKVVAMDILFPERSPLIGQTSPDAVLAESIKNFQKDGRRVFIAYTVSDSEAEEALEEAPVEMLNDAILTRNVPESDLRPRKIEKFNFPIPELVSTEVGLASISQLEDLDGVNRQYLLVSNIDTTYYGSLGFNAFEAFTGNKNTIKIFADGTGELDLEGSKLEISRRGETNIRYVGAEDQFDDVSLFDVLKADDQDQAMHQLFRNKMVFVGSTAVGAHDLRSSPIHTKMPGVYAHINMANMLLNKYFFKNSNESVIYSLYLLITGMMIFLVVQHFGNAFFDALITGSIIYGCYLADKHYFFPKGYELKLFYCFNCFIGCYSWNTFLKFYEASKEKKQIRGTFARYVAPTIVDEMLKDPEKLHVGGTKMDITCLFSDVRDFTKISEGLSANELASSLNIYMGAMTDIVFDTKGTLDKYIGDAIVAIWGAPLPIGNHAQYAVEAAIEMINSLPKINEEFRKLGRPEFNVGIGLNSGECSVGNMGSSRIFSYTALGDNMNLGSRLESLCKYYGAQIIISQMTLDRLDLSRIKTRQIDKVIVKGKTQAVAIYEVLHTEHWMVKNPTALEKYHQAITLFKERHFQEAYELFESLYSENPNDKINLRYKTLVSNFISHPELVTDQFDVTTMTEK